MSSNPQPPLGKLWQASTWLAALGGALAAPMRALGPSMGDRIIIESFIVVVIGGMGSLPGVLVGSLIVGLTRSFTVAWYAELEMPLLFLIAVIILIVRPQGLFGQK